MSVSISIVPLSCSIDMYGEPNVSSAYSLSGHISITISSVQSYFERRRAARFLLQSLEITFEGQSELISPKTGYNGVRLCSVTKELAPSEPMEINNDGQEDSSEPSVWNVVFNLTIPGWLPPSTLFGQDEEGGIRYFLHATAKFSTLPDALNTPWSLSTLYSSFRSKHKALSTSKGISIHRLANRPSVPASKESIFPPIAYAINSRPPPPKEGESPDFPRDVLSKIQVLASIPEFVDVSAGTLPFTLRMRTSDLSEDERQKLQVTGFTVEFEQTEKYKSASLTDYLSRYPIPPLVNQPPNLPLRNAHPISTIYELGLYDQPIELDATIARKFSILASGETGQYNLADNTHIFVADGGATDPSTWYTIDTLIPFNSGRQPEYHWAGPQRLRASSASPQFGVRHQLHISLLCKYGAEGGEKKAAERLNFTLPVYLVNVAPARPRRPLARASSSSSLSSITAVTGEQPSNTNDSIEHCLPAYSQLYHSNGDRKIDYSIPLPLYTPKPVDGADPILIAYSPSPQPETKILDIVSGNIPRPVEEEHTVTASRHCT